MIKELTYEACGISTKRSKEKKKFIKSINELVENHGVGKYVIGGIGGFCGLWDWAQQKRDENRDYILMQSTAKYLPKKLSFGCSSFKGLVDRVIKEYGTKRAPYVFVGVWLQRRRENMLKKLNSGNLK